MKDLRQVIRRPVITEKSTIERETRNIVTFEELFDVKVEDVRTLRVRGKMRRVGKTQGQRPSWKKARVRLRAGDSIEFFEGV